MINREATIRWKGYDPINLKAGSNKRVWDNCNICGRGRWVIYHQANRLCTTCSNKGENNAMYDVHLFGEDNGHWKGGKVILICDNCKNEIERFPSCVNEYNFCDHECHNEWMSKNQCGENNPNWRGGLGKLDDWRDWSKVVYLNESFSGCHRHHITKTIVVHIPAKLHNSISHNLKTGRGMGEINMLALQFINNYYNEVI